MSAVEFEVPFVRGEARPRFTRTGHAYSDPRDAEARAAIAEAAMAALPEGAELPLWPRGTPVAVRVDTSRPLPASRPVRVMSEPDTFKPDIDNVEKLVYDALNGVLWEDDRQVVEHTGKKWPRSRGAAERTAVRCWPLGGAAGTEE